MKVLKQLTLLLLLTTVFIGCNKDDDDNNEPTLFDSWKITSAKNNNLPEELDACDLKFTITFTETNMSFNEYYGENCDSNYGYTMAYTRNGNTLIVGTGSDAESMEITKLTDTTLEITDVDGTDIYVETYTRQ
ncbi:lipocalin family protein [Aequorivita sp. SDUM287046]|uniref:Lipocalin family protein n=1 Tax=Aequorivita aurantiaca TaxID=3053356 RepID=A0ABT8DKE4_9FLAO|nr:lipocalin family protein [Aequorivita aurantiaca]MDN3724375.1 lipocalin family protein [Aequorivita aurantiaca]